VKPYIDDGDFRLYVGDVRDVLRELPAGSVDCCVTSPPYLLEPTIGEYVAELVGVFREVRRLLADTGSLWLNLGDSYNAYNGGAGPGSKLSKIQTEARPRLATGFGLQQKEFKPKDLMGIPWRVALALQDDGWYLRADVIWHKPNPMPESITDRPTKSHEYVFLLTKSARYFFDQEAVREKWSGEDRSDEPVNGSIGVVGQKHSGRRGPDGRRKTTVAGAAGSIQHRDGERWPNGGRNIRSVWEIATQPYPNAHFATFPEALPERCIKAGCPEGGTVLDPFLGSGTTALVARRLGRKSVGIEPNAEYAKLAARRLQQLSLLAEDVA
jgi:DNA modification methylase